VKWDDVTLVDQLIKAGANVNAANRVGATPMFIAAVNGSAAIIEKLLVAGVDPNAPLLSSKETAIMVAARTGKPEAVKVLLDRGAQANAKESLRGTTALMWASEQGHADVIALLASRGADVAATSSVTIPRAGRGNDDDDAADIAQGIPIGGMTPLVFAAREGHMDAVKALLAANADVNQTSADGSSALLVAVLNGNYDLAVYLMNQGASPNVTNRKGWTPLYQAVKNRNLEVGAVPLMKTGVMLDELELIKIILDKGADPNIRAKANFQSRNGQGGTWMQENGATPFLRAALNGDITVMKMLLPYGADPGIPTADGTTPLMVLGGVGFAEGFIFHHSDKETMEALRLLLDLGADVNATNKRGLTALHGAAHRGDDNVIRVLAEHGAILNRMDQSPPADGRETAGLTPLDWAIGVRISAASPIYKESTVELLTSLLRQQGLPVPEAALKTIGGKRSAAGAGKD
jgi:ankyrin repeat protein